MSRSATVHVEWLISLWKRCYSGVVELCCVACILEGVSKFVYHVCMCVVGCAAYCLPS